MQFSCQQNHHGLQIKIPISQVIFFLEHMSYEKMKNAVGVKN
jgi:hypothetical protein